jgi:hypothetical protein
MGIEMICLLKRMGMMEQQIEIEIRVGVPKPGIMRSFLIDNDNGMLRSGLIDPRENKQAINASYIRVRTCCVCKNQRIKEKAMTTNSEDTMECQYPDNFKLSHERLQV